MGNRRNIWIWTLMGIVATGAALRLGESDRIVPTYASPSIKGVNPDIQVPLPPVQDQQKDPVTPPPRPKSNVRDKGVRPPIKVDPDHAVLWVEQQVKCLAQAVIVAVGDLITKLFEAR